MKYSEYLQIREILESQNIKISEHFNLNEADTAANDIETEKSTIFTKWGRIKKTLNKTAKKTQDQVIKGVINKYLPNVLKLERSVIESLVTAKKQNKKGKELRAILNNSIKKTSTLQKKQLDAIYSYVDKTLDNADAAFDKKIAAAESSKTITQILDITAAFFKGGKDSAALKLKNYWQLLHTQIQMNAYDYISKTIQADAKKMLNDEELEKVYAENSFSTRYNNEHVTAGKKEEEQNKQNIKTEETNATTDKEKETSKLEAGKKYTVDFKDSGKKEVEVISVDDKEITYKIIGDEREHKLDIKYAPFFNGPIDNEKTKSEEGEQKDNVA